MVAHGFKARFGPPICAGIQDRTIRADRKRHARPAEPVQLFTGMRTKHRREIGEPRCEDVSRFLITYPRTRRPAAIEVERRTGDIGAVAA